MAAADLHGDDDEFGDDGELAGEGGVDAWVAEGEADGAVGGDDFEEDGEEREGVFVGVGESVAFGDGDDEEAEGDVPEIEPQLAPEMGPDVGGLFFVFGFFGAGAPDAEGFFFVDVGAADRDGDREDGDVHHDHIGDLDAGVEGGEVDGGKAGGAGGGGLEEAVEETEAGGVDAGDCWVVELGCGLVAVEGSEGGVR